MQERQEKLLKIIVKEYIKTAEPVSSGFLVRKFRLPFSSATVRNEMAKLEEDGYIYQPHTSAGRIPTEKAYHFYIKNALVRKKVKSNTELQQQHDEISLKNTAKDLAEKSGLAVFWSTDKNNSHYTGISNLLSQPEFLDTQEVLNFSKIIDDIDNIVLDIYSHVSNEPEILIGRKNPFGASCSSIVVKYQDGDNQRMFGIVGPMRMDYEQCLGLINFILNKL